MAKNQTGYRIAIFLYTAASALIGIFLRAGLPLLLFAGRGTGRLARRLGHGLPVPRADRVIWVHALSVGEVTSALPLVRGLRQAYPEAALIFSVTTRSGMDLARRLVRPHVTALLFGPLDVPFAVQRFLDRLDPSLFILVETDFWPGWLAQLHRRQLPAMLVNGRVSARSARCYQRFAFFFRPMFSTFSILAMQAAENGAAMERLGIPADRIRILGNLKFDQRSGETAPGIDRKALSIADTAPIWVCGSTHPGEENELLAAFSRLRQTVPGLVLVLAPRDIGRARELVRLAERACGSVRLRSTGQGAAEPRVVILDTIGELAACYGLACLAFVGGSLVPEGGHNPLEPAARGVPVLFGPHMEDFPEIAAELCAAGAACQVNKETLAREALSILTDPDRSRRMARAAATTVYGHHDVVQRHLEAIAELLPPRNDHG